MNRPADVVIPLSTEAALGAHALWMLGVSVMVGVVVIAGLASAVLAVRMSH